MNKCKLHIMLLSLICLTNCLFSFSQDYEVLSFTKINESTSGFNQVLESEDWFGYAVEGIGDLNDDGINDVAISALQDDDGGFNRGAVYILFLTSDGTINSTQKISNNTGGFTGVLEDWDIFGTSISYLGDLDSDGKIEIAVGAEYDGDGDYRHGAVWILSLNADGTVFSQQKISSLEGNFNGDLDIWDVFGTDVENIGDLNDDGNVDIAVGARRDGDGGSERGAVWILFLNNDFTVSSHQKISSDSQVLSGVLDNQDYFGGAVANIGDLNQDGIIDLAVGAYRDDDGNNNSGAIYILFLNDNGTLDSFQKISETQGGLNDTLPQNSRFGTSIDLFYDINEDGKKEILVGNSGYGSNSNSDEGSFYVLNLNNNGTVDSYEKYSTDFGFNDVLSSGDYFGFSVSTIGTLNDQVSIIVGAFGDSESNFQGGSAYIVQLKKTMLSLEEFDNKHDFKIYPNPTSDSFYLKTEFQDNYTIYVIDVNGRLIKTLVSNPENKYDVSELKSGIYLIDIRFKNSNEGSVFKMIKE